MSVLSLTTHQKYHQNNFHLLRFLAALFVLVSHSFGILDKGMEQPKIWFYQQLYILSDLGLCMFFTISGYLVTQSLQRSGSWKDYLRKRFLRIVPALVVTTILVVIMGSFVTHLTIGSYWLERETWSYLLTNISLIKNQFTLPGVFSNLRNNSVNASIWTIPVEVKCYLLLLLASLLKILTKRWIFLIGFLFLQLTRVVVTEVYKFSIAFIDVDVYFLYGTYFYLGALFFCFKDTIPLKWPVALILFAIAMATGATIIKVVTLSIFVSYIILLFGTAKPLLNFKDYDVSYGMYLYAFPVQQLVILYYGYSINAWLHILISATISFIIALFSWKYIEKPFLRKK